jgi:hypothetical protein
MRREDDQQLLSISLCWGVLFAILSVAEENKVNDFDD